MFICGSYKIQVELEALHLTCQLYLKWIKFHLFYGHIILSSYAWLSVGGNPDYLCFLLTSPQCPLQLVSHPLLSLFRDFGVKKVKCRHCQLAVVFKFFQLVKRANFSLSKLPRVCFPALSLFSWKWNRVWGPNICGIWNPVWASLLQPGPLE